MAESFLLGDAIYTEAKSTRPAARAILAITNPRDPAVNNALTRALIGRWRQHRNIGVREYRFGRDIGPLHDIIAPYQPNARVDVVYPVVFDLIDSSAARADDAPA